MPETMEELRAECMSCTSCRLAETRNNTVFGEGSDSAKVLFIGEGPGEREDAEGRPFCGRSGKLLDDMLSMIGLSRADVYIANIVKCRPPNNRDPLPDEQDACIGWLRRQVRALKPQIIVSLGRVAAKRIIKDDFKITEEHGRWFERDGYRLTATFHPAALLRNPNHKPLAFDDFESIRKALETL